MSRTGAYHLKHLRDKILNILLLTSIRITMIVRCNIFAYNHEFKLPEFRITPSLINPYLYLRKIHVEPFPGSKKIMPS